ncbi:MAG TPA: high-affinity nickel-transport family protein [Polyangiaceae bacterium]
MNIFAVLVLGFALGMRHATDADHVVAVSTIVTRQRSIRAALPIGVAWGLGHTVTILLVGAAIIFFGVAIPPRVGRAMELCVALMLVVLGAINVRSVARGTRAERTDAASGRGALRPFVVGIVHGLAGSAAIALLVLGAIRSAWWGAFYLGVFGGGTMVGMALVTLVLAVPMAISTRRFERVHRALALATGIGSCAFGLVLAYQIGVVDGLFTQHPLWTPQ